MSDPLQQSSDSLSGEIGPDEQDTLHTPENLSIPELVQYLKQIRQEDRRSKSESIELREEISHLDKKLKDRESQRRVLKEISEELELARKFLSTADGLSPAGAVRETERLNEEVLHLTSIMAYEYLQIGEKKLPTKEGRAFLVQRSGLLNKLGDSLDHIMAENLGDATAIQIGWQTILTHWCMNIIRDWVLEGVAPEFHYSQCMPETYKQILRKNDPTVTRRWRSIVYGATSNISEKRQRTLVIRVLTALADLPVYWGYVFDQEVYNNIYKEFRRRIGPIIDQSLRLRMILGRDIASVEIRPYVLPPGAKYNPERADLYEDGSDETEELSGIIACSTSLGLNCTTRSRNPSGDFEDSTDPILKPQVILFDTLKKIIL